MTEQHESADTAAGLTHLRAYGTARMVDVSGKAPTRRVASAASVLRTRPDVVAAVADGTLPKGEAIGTARIAGIMAAKRTSELIPLCHPLALSSVEVDISAAEGGLAITATVVTTGPTGVEMEALTAVSVAALTLYDMIKAVDPRAVIADTRVTGKSGGRSGDWVVDDGPGPREEPSA